MPFAAAGIAALTRAAGKGLPVTTDDARKLFGISKPRWVRMSRRSGFPDRIHEGRSWFVDPQSLANYLTLCNRIEAGMSLSQTACLTRHAIKTIRAMVAREVFPAPIGYRRGPRFARDQVEAWLHEHRRGLALQKRATKRAPRKRRPTTGGSR